MSAQASMNRPLPSLDYGVGVGVGLLLAGLIGFALARIGSVPLKADIYGELGQVSAEDVYAAASPFLAAGFFQIDVEALELRLEALPWVREAQVQRLWPDRLAVRVLSHQPWARWGEHAVLSAEGVLISPPEQPDLALRIEAPERMAAEVFTDLTGILERLPADWRLVYWQVSSTGDRQARLEVNARVIALEFGREPVAEKLKLLADVVLPVLKPRWSELAAVDLRYRNGFAVRWLDGSKENAQ